MEGAMPNTPLDREEDKKEIFARVWKRVMGDHTDACPITWEETGGDQAQTTTEQQQTLVTEEAAQTEEKTVLPAPHVPRGGQRLHSDFPRDDAQGVLGPQCLDCAPLLQELIRRELADCREYQTLSRRAGGGPARVLAGLAGEKKRRAKRRSAAYFLISGVRFWPVDRLAAPDIPSYLGSIRRAYLAEQQREQAYLLAGDDTTDTALVELYRDLAELSRGHGEQLRTILEQSRF